MKIISKNRWWRGVSRFASTLIAVALFGSVPAQAALQIRIEDFDMKPLPIAIPDFLGGTAMGKDIAGVVRGDLERSGLFKPLDPASYVERITDINVPPRFG